MCNLYRKVPKLKKMRKSIKLSMNNVVSIGMDFAKIWLSISVPYWICYIRKILWYGTLSPPSFIPWINHVNNPPKRTLGFPFHLSILFILSWMGQHIVNVFGSADQKKIIVAGYTCFTD